LLTSTDLQGFEVIKQLMAQTQPWNFILGVRDTTKVQTAFDRLKYDTSRHNLTLLPLDLAQVKNVKAFAHRALEKLGFAGKIDYLLLNAGLAKSAEEKGSHPKWCESYIVNHLSQHYLVHLLKDKLVASKSRIVFVSSGAIRSLKDTSTIEPHCSLASHH
jgi:NAD(P)-dependent dehydrogenase (short-subunit alcohol dehydrogenase family)